MGSISRGGPSGWRDLSHYLPARARMRPVLRRKAQSLVHRGDLSPDCVVTSFFEAGESVMCVVQIAIGAGARQTLIAPLAQIAFERGGPLAKEIEALRARGAAREAAIRQREPAVASVSDPPPEPS